jgi:hypothetical protein
LKRIYFDKQVFSYLLNGREDRFVELRKLLDQTSKEFLFVFSQAHILDLENDKTDIKYEELDYMETVVKDNYLTYDAIKKVATCQLATPRMVFDSQADEDEPESFTTLLDDFDLDGLDDELKQKLGDFKLLMTEMPITMPGISDKNLPEEYSKFKDILNPEDKQMSILEWGDKFMGLHNSMKEDKSLYKELRKLSVSESNTQFEIDFESFQEKDDDDVAILSDSFVANVNAGQEEENKKNISTFDFFIRAYMSLDLLGISKEPAGKVQYRNLVNDAHHSYYGTLSDLVVSDDIGFVKKSKALYRLLGIKTEVLTTTQFIATYGLMARSSVSDSQKFIALVKNDALNGVVLKRWKSVEFNRTTLSIKPGHTYLGLFNAMDIIEEEGQTYIVLSVARGNRSNFTFYREYEAVVNRAIRIFGTDAEFVGEYKWPEENNEIHESKWTGRLWDFGDAVRLRLEINEGDGKLCAILEI